METAPSATLAPLPPQQPLRVLIIGGGGREHALAWKCAQSPRVERIYVAPGNGGTARTPRLENVAIAATEVASLVAFARANTIDLTIVGPEAPLVAGVVDAFAAAGLRCFGPRRSGAQLEGSKAFTKAFLARHHIPTAAYQSFTDAEAAKAYIAHHGAPIVVKADGLAAGKGVVVAKSEAEALAAIDEMMLHHTFGAAGQRVVVEEFLSGEEASFMVITDGTTALPLATSQDHKARDDGDAGPNTGGMGAYSPAPVITPALQQRIMAEIIAPTLAGLRADGVDYCGFLYAGLMIDSQGNPKVLEYNCRLGDPETQPLMLRLNSDLPDLCLAALDGTLANQTIAWDPRPALGVVMAAQGYPGAYRKGDPIAQLPPNDEQTMIFHSGTALQGDQVVTQGGRVLCVTALGDDIAHARATAYGLVERAAFEGAFWRRDIGHRALR